MSEQEPEDRKEPPLNLGDAWAAANRSGSIALTVNLRRTPATEVKERTNEHA